MSSKGTKLPSMPHSGNVHANKMLKINRKKKPLKPALANVFFIPDIEQKESGGT